MSKPREILNDQFYLLTRRCLLRMFLLRPDAHTWANFRYCLALAAERTGVTVMLPVVMSNHHHVVVHDPDRRVVDFMHYLHWLVARAMNAVRGRRENFWTAEQGSLVRLETREAVLRAMVYVATNPVKDHLVARIHQWPGVHGLRDLMRGDAWNVPRPRGFFSANGALPAEATLQLTVPAGTMLGDVDAFLAELADRVAARETELIAARGSKRVLGVRAVQQQSPFATPTAPVPRGDRRPTEAVPWRWSRAEAKQRSPTFLERYQAARLAWCAGLAAEFPPGTYWLRRFARITVAEV